MRRLLVAFVIGIATVAIAALARADATAPTRAPAVVVWETGNGWVTFTVEASGAARYDYHPTGRGARPDEAKRIDGRIAKADLDRLRALLEKQRACGLRSERRLPVPEEGRSSLTLAMAPDLRCTVTLWSNEWREQERARPVAELLDGLAERVRTGAK